MQQSAVRPGDGDTGWPLVRASMLVWALAAGTGSHDDFRDGALVVHYWLGGALGLWFGLGFGLGLTVLDRALAGLGWLALGSGLGLAAGLLVEGGWSWVATWGLFGAVVGLAGALAGDRPGGPGWLGAKLDRLLRAMRPQPQLVRWSWLVMLIAAGALVFAGAWLGDRVGPSEAGWGFGPGGEVLAAQARWQASQVVGVLIALGCTAFLAGLGRLAPAMFRVWPWLLLAVGSLFLAFGPGLLALKSPFFAVESPMAGRLQGDVHASMVGGVANAGLRLVASSEGSPADVAMEGVPWNSHGLTAEHEALRAPKRRAPGAGLGTRTVMLITVEGALPQWGREGVFSAAQAVAWVTGVEPWGARGQVHAWPAHGQPWISWWSLATGRYPRAVDWEVEEAGAAPSCQPWVPAGTDVSTTVWEGAQSAGWQTAAVVSGPCLGAMAERAPFFRGFQKVDVVASDLEAVRRAAALLQAPADKGGHPAQWIWLHLQRLPGVALEGWGQEGGSGLRDGWLRRHWDGEAWAGNSLVVVLPMAPDEDGQGVGAAGGIGVPVDVGFWRDASYADLGLSMASWAGAELPVLNDPVHGTDLWHWHQTRRDYGPHWRWQDNWFVGADGGLVVDQVRGGADFGMAVWDLVGEQASHHRTFGSTPHEPGGALHAAWWYLRVMPGGPVVE